MRWFWVDRFSEYVAGSHAVGHKGVALSDEFMHDHWESFPVMPHSLIAEGMAQTAGLLVSELYDFKELVVLAKFTKLEFDGLLRPGQTIAYRAEVGAVKEFGAQASVVGTVEGRQQSRAEIFFARMQAGPTMVKGVPERIFDPEDLAHWLQITDVFKVGVHQDGTKMRPADYGMRAYA